MEARPDEGFTPPGSTTVLLCDLQHRGYGARSIGGKIHTESVGRTREGNFTIAYEFHPLDTAFIVGRILGETPHKNVAVFGPTEGDGIQVFGRLSETDFISSSIKIGTFVETLVLEFDGSIGNRALAENGPGAR